MASHITKPPRAKSKMKNDNTEVVTLPSIVAELRKPNGRPRKLYTIEEEMDAWIQANDGTLDIHQALKVGFEVTIPRVFVGLSNKASTGEPVAAKLILEWWSKWKQEDVARTLNVTPDRATSTSWVQQAVGVTPVVTSTPDVVTPHVTNAGDATHCRMCDKHNRSTQ